MSRLAFALAALSVLALACRDESSRAPNTRALNPIPSASGQTASLPPDHLAPGELAEGTEKAFGLTLPRAFRVTRRFDTSVFATGSVSPESAANYLRRRLDAEATEVGPTRTILVKAKVRGGDQAVTLHVEVSEAGAGAEIVVRNVTPTPPEPGLSEEERWKREGLLPNGKVANPTKLFLVGLGVSAALSAGSRGTRGTRRHRGDRSTLHRGRWRSSRPCRSSPR